MENNKDFFNSDNYIETNEGMFQKFTKWIKEKFQVLLQATILGIKIQWILAFFTVITSTIAIIEFFEKDAGDIIEELYQLEKSNVTETYKHITMVQLPDSIESKEEVQELRLLQNEIYKHKIASSSLFNQIRSCNWNTTDNNEQKAIIKRIRYISYNIIILLKLNNAIYDRFVTFVEQRTHANDSLTMLSINLNCLEELPKNQSLFNKKLEECNIKLYQIKDPDQALDLLCDLYASKELSALFESCRETHLLMLNTINIRLLDIKKEALEKNISNIHSQPLTINITNKYSCP